MAGSTVVPSPPFSAIRLRSDPCMAGRIPAFPAWLRGREIISWTIAVASLRCSPRSKTHRCVIHNKRLATKGCAQISPGPQGCCESARLRRCEACEWNNHSLLFVPCIHRGCKATNVQLIISRPLRLPISCRAGRSAKNRCLAGRSPRFQIQFPVDAALSAAVAPPPNALYKVTRLVAWASFRLIRPC